MCFSIFSVLLFVSIIEDQYKPLEGFSNFLEYKKRLETKNIRMATLRYLVLYRLGRQMAAQRGFPQPDWGSQAWAWPCSQLHFSTKGLSANLSKDLEGKTEALRRTSVTLSPTPPSPFNMKLQQREFPEDHIMQACSTHCAQWAGGTSRKEIVLWKSQPKNRILPRKLIILPAYVPQVEGEGSKPSLA